MKNATEKYKTVFPYDNVRSSSENEFIKYVDTNDVVPNPFDASKYYSDEGCLLEASLQSMTEAERKSKCNAVYY